MKIFSRTASSAHRTLQIGSLARRLSLTLAIGILSTGGLAMADPSPGIEIPPAEQPPAEPPPGEAPPGDPPPPEPPPAVTPTPTPAPTPSASGETVFSSEVPELAENNDGVPYELGMKFQADVAGDINAIRYWKTPSETGLHTGHIWAADGTLLASVTFTDETASGWQEQPLTPPLAIAANTTYVVSVNSSYYPFTGYGLAAPIVNGHVRTVADGANGLFGPPATFPTNTYHSANYFRDIAFTPARVRAAFSVVGDWQAGFQGRILVSNPTPNRTETWSVEVDFVDRQITQIWGADITSITSRVEGDHVINTYKLTPPDWNKRISPGATVEIGFLASPGDVTPDAVRVSLVQEVSHSSDETATYALSGASVLVTKEGDWQTGAVLKFRITNNGTAALTDWQLTTLFPRPIQSIWNAASHAGLGSDMIFDAQDFAWQKDIPAGGTVEFGLIASPGALTNLPLVTGLVSTTPAPEPEAPESDGTPPTDPGPPPGPEAPPTGAFFMTIFAPTSVTVEKSTANVSLEISSGGDSSKIEAKAQRKATAKVSGKNPYNLKVVHLSRGRTKVKVKAVTADGTVVRKTINVIRH